MVFQVGTTRNSYSPKYTETIKSKKFLDEKCSKITKKSHTYKLIQVLIIWNFKFF